MVPDLLENTMTKRKPLVESDWFMLMALDKARAEAIGALISLILGVFLLWGPFMELLK